MSVSGKTTRTNIPKYTDKDELFLRSDINEIVDKIDEVVGTGSAPVLSVNGKIGDVVLDADDVGAVEKETGKGLSTNDFTDTYKTMVDTHDTEIGELQSDKQDKEAGKGLSTNDFTNGYKVQISDNTNRLNDHDTLIDNLENTKQDTITAGDGITLENNEISAKIDNDSIIIDSQGNMSAPGGIPIQLEVMPEPTTPEEIVQWLGKIRQYIGQTTGTYKNGYYYIYELNAVTGVYKWTEKAVQAGGSGGGGGVKTVNDKLPDTEGNVQLVPNDIGAYNKSEINDFINPINESLETHEQELVRLNTAKASAVIIESAVQQTISGKLVPVLTENQINNIITQYKIGSIVIIKDTIGGRYYSIISAYEYKTDTEDKAKIICRYDNDLVFTYEKNLSIITMSFTDIATLVSTVSGHTTSINQLQLDMTQAQSDITEAQDDISTLQTDLQDEIDDRVAGDSALASRVQAVENALPNKVDSTSITHETWEFTLEDEITKVNKEVVLWVTSQKHQTI